jgi:hypothetical protein
MCLVISAVQPYSTGISLVSPSQINRGGIRGSLVGVAVSKDWDARVDRSFVEANAPHLNDYFAGAYPGEQWGNQIRGFAANSVTDTWRDGDSFGHLVDFLGQEDRAPVPQDFLEVSDDDGRDLIDLSDDLIDFSDDLIDFSDNATEVSKPVDKGAPPLFDWLEMISDEEFALDELMVAAMPDSQDGSKTGRAGVTGYLAFDDISFDETSSDESNRITNKKPPALSNFLPDEALKKIASEAASISRLIQDSSPELTSLPEPEFVPSVPKSISGMTGHRLLRAEVTSG